LPLVSDEPGAAGEQLLVPRLRAVIAAKDEQIAALWASLETALAALEGERELRRRLELRVAELERRLSVDSTDSGTPKERIGAKQARKARQQSGRERRTDRKRGGQPGHQGKGLQRDPDPDETKAADPPFLEAMPALADPGYEGAGHGVHVPVKKPPGVKELDINTRTRNALLRSARCLGERGFALLTQRWRTLQHVTASPGRIGLIARAALVLVLFEHKMIT